MEIQLSEIEIDSFFKNGYIIIKNYLKKIDYKIENYLPKPKREPIRIHSLRKYINDSYMKEFNSKTGEFIKSSEHFINLFINNTISQVLKKIYPGEKYFSSGLHKSFTSKFHDTQDGKPKWHIDTYHASNEQITNDDFHILKALIYLQSDYNYSSKLKVIPGSHLKCDILKRNGPYDKVINTEKKIIKLDDKDYYVNVDTNAVNLDINEGDLVLFDIRLVHSGHSSVIKEYPNLVLSDNCNLNEKFLLPKISSVKDRFIIQNEYIIGDKYINIFNRHFERKCLFERLYNNVKLNYENIHNLEFETNIQLSENVYKYSINES